MENSTPIDTYDVVASMHTIFARLGATPANPHASPGTLAGLDFMRSIPDGRLPIGDLLDFRLIEAEHGRAVFAGKPAFAYYTPLGRVHGGWAATLLDSAMGGAVCSVLGVGKLFTTVELKVNYVRAVTGDTGPMRAEGQVINAGRTIATAEGRLVDAHGKLYAHGTTTCLIRSEAPDK